MPVGRRLDLAAAREQPRMQHVLAAERPRQQKVTVVAGEQRALAIGEKRHVARVPGKRAVEIEIRQLVGDVLLQPRAGAGQIAHAAQGSVHDVRAPGAVQHVMLHRRPGVQNLKGTLGPGLAVHRSASLRAAPHPDTLLHCLCLCSIHAPIAGASGSLAGERGVSVASARAAGAGVFGSSWLRPDATFSMNVPILSAPLLMVPPLAAIMTRPEHTPAAIVALRRLSCQISASLLPAYAAMTGSISLCRSASGIAESPVAGGASLLLVMGKPPHAQRRA